HADELARLLAHLDFVSGAYLVRRNVHATPIHIHVTVTDKLAGLAARDRESQPINHVVQAALKLLQEQLAGDARLARCHFKLVAELVFQAEVDALGLLLFAQLQAVTYNLGLAVLAMLARSKVTLFHRALVAETLGPFQKQLHAFASAKAAYWSFI